MFTNLLLADEINRTPPKTQAASTGSDAGAKRVSSGGEEFKLDEPFFVLATQNPIEQEGTYPLPEAQLDRFLFNIMVKYPSHTEELDIVRKVTGDDEPDLKEVVDTASILDFQHLVRRIPVSDHVNNYAVALVRATRPDAPERAGLCKESHGLGCGPASLLEPRPRPAKRGRPCAGVVTFPIDDIKALCLPVLRHRIIPNFAARSEGETSDTLIAKLLDEVPSDEKLLGKKAS